MISSLHDAWHVNDANLLVIEEVLGLITLRICCAGYDRSHRRNKFHEIGFIKLETMVSSQKPFFILVVAYTAV